VHAGPPECSAAAADPSRALRIAEPSGANLRTRSATERLPFVTMAVPEEVVRSAKATTEKPPAWPKERWLFRRP